MRKGQSHTDESKAKQSKSMKGCMAWNKGTKGYEVSKPKTDNIDWSLIPSFVANQYDITDISKEFNLSYPTIRKYIKLKYPDLLIEVRKNGIKKKSHPKHGGLIGYHKIFKLKKDYCEYCGVDDRRLELHHIIPSEYKSDWNVAFGNHNELNIKTLCNSCHQKEHYRKLGRISKVKRDPETGRFIKN